MSVTIIIPCYNAERYIGQAIESALNQRIRCEVIVVDDGSTDGSWEQVLQFGDLVRAVRQKNSGAPAARNFGLSLCSSDYVKFLDADDVLEPNSLESQLNFRKSHDLADNELSFGCFSSFDEISAFEIEHRWPVETGLGVPFSWLLFNQILVSTPLYTRAALQSVGGFVSGLARGQEFDLNIRLHLAGVRFIYDSVHCFRYRQHSDGVRISSGKLSSIAAAQMKMVQGWIHFIHEHPDAACDAKKADIARYTWKVGRSLVQRGRSDLASAFFECAKGISSQDYIMGSRLYRMSVHAMNPVWAEGMGRFGKFFKDSVAAIRRIRTSS